MTMSTVILNTRPVLYRAVMHDILMPLGLRVIDAPVLDPRPLAVVVPPAAKFDALIFTSQIAAAFFPADDAWRAKAVYAVGDATAAAARRAGFARIVSAAGDARDLARMLAGATFRRALYPSATDVAAALDCAFAGRIVRLPTYRMDAISRFDRDTLRDLRAATRIILPVFSRRSARAIAAALAGAAITAEVIAVGISPAALDIGAIPPWSDQVAAREPTLDAVVAAIRGVIARAPRAARAA